MEEKITVILDKSSSDETLSVQNDAFDKDCDIEKRKFFTLPDRKTRVKIGVVFVVIVVVCSLGVLQGLMLAAHHRAKYGNEYEDTEVAVEVVEKETAIVQTGEECLTFQDHCYVPVQEAQTYHDARKKCERMSSHLAFIASHEEYAFVTDEIRHRMSGKHFWLGMMFDRYGSVVKFDNGTFAHFVKWSENYPPGRRFQKRHVRLALQIHVDPEHGDNGMRDDLAELSDKLFPLCERHVHAEPSNFSPIAKVKSDIDS